jgi:hypothetical protein
MGQDMGSLNGGILSDMVGLQSPVFMLDSMALVLCIGGPNSTESITRRPPASP